MRILIFLTIIATIPTNAIAGSFDKGTRDGFHSYCVTKAKKPDKFCQCAEDLEFQAMVDGETARQDNIINNARKTFNKEQAQLLQDPAMSVARINEICDVADEYYGMIKAYPLKYTGDPDTRKMTYEQRLDLHEKNTALKNKVRAFHDKYGSNNRTKSVLAEAGSGYCMQRTVNKRLEKEYADYMAKEDAEEVVVSYRSVLHAAMKSRSCNEFLD